MSTPYIGISAVMSREDADAIMSMVPRDYPRRIMIGTVASNVTLAGGVNSTPTKFPTMDQMPGIFPDHPMALNLIHWNSRTTAGLLDELRAIARRGGPNCDGLQLNMVWPAPSILSAFKHERPDTTIVLQIDSEALAAVGNSSTRLAIKLGEYQGVVDYILLNQCRGRGVVFDCHESSRYLEAMFTVADFLDCGVALAGGISVEMLDETILIKQRFPKVSINAESGLRDENGHLDLKRVREYLKVYTNLFPI